MKKNIYKVLIESCWILLIFCFALKLLFGNLFAISVESQNFIAFCDWLDTHWLKYIIATIVYVPSTYLVYCCLTKQKLGKDLWLLLFLLPMAFVKERIAIIGVIIEFIYLLVIPLIKSKFKNFKWIILGIVMIYIFQLISLLVRNVGFYIDNSSMLIGLIMQIDYYIMLVLYYLYIHYRKEMS